MTAKRTIPASAARPGSTYLSPRGTKIKVLGPVEGSTDVRVENEHGRPFTVQEAYPLEPMDSDAPVLEDLVGLEGDALTNAVAQLEAESLDALEDLDPRPEVLAATEARRAELEGSSPDAAAGKCPECAQDVPALESRGRLVLQVHQGTDGSYCSGSGTPLPGQAPAPAPAPTTPAPTVPKIAVSEEPAHVLALLTTEVQTPSQLHAREDCHLTSVEKVSRALSALVSSGKAERQGRGKYRLAPAASRLPRGECPACLRSVALRVGGELREHSAVSGSSVPICPASGHTLEAAAELLASDDPADADNDPNATTEDPVTDPAPAELEDETQPTETDPWRHLEGATTKDQRVAAIRRVQLESHLDELESIRGELQTKAARELDRHRKALEAMGAAIRSALEDGNQADLDRLSKRQDYQARPGVLARARAAYAVLQGKGEAVDTGVRPVTPADLEDPDLAELTSATAPAELEALVAFLESWTNRPSFPAELVKDVAAMTGTVRESRQALADQEDVGRVRLAWAWECYRQDQDRRPTVLDQLEARISALGEEPAERPAPGQLELQDAVAEAKASPLEAAVAKAREEASHPLTHPGQVAGLARELLAELQALGDARPAAFMAGRAGEDCPDGADPLDAELHALGLEAFQELVDAGVVQAKAVDQVEPDPALTKGLAALEDHAAADTAPAATWDLSQLPLEDQVARSTGARALELVAELDRPGLVFKAMVKEQEGRNRPDVQAALEARRVELVSAAQEAPAPELEAAGPAVRESKAPRPAPAPAPQGHVQVKDLDVLELPDGRRELWAKVPGHRPVRLGDYEDPRLAQARQALEAFRAQEAPQATPAPAPAPQVAPPPSVDQAAVQAAQAALASLAAGLPALAAMGVEVEIKISTKSRL